MKNKYKLLIFVYSLLPISGFCQSSINNIKIEKNTEYNDITKIAKKFDVSGVYLGEDCQSASNVLLKILPEEHVLKGEVRILGPNGSIPSEQFVQKIELSDPASNSSAELYCSSPAMGSVVLRIKKTIQYLDVKTEKNTQGPTLDTIKNQIKEKYGVDITNVDIFPFGKEYSNKFYITSDSSIHQIGHGSDNTPEPPNNGGDITSPFDSNKYAIVGKISANFSNSSQIDKYTIDIYDMYNYKKNMEYTIKFLSSETKKIQSENTSKADL